jgi:predicted transcriptional regulator
MRASEKRGATETEKGLRLEATKDQLHKCRYAKVVGRDEISLNVSHRRDRLQILADILVLCKIPRNKTTIMYKTNLSYAALVRNLNFLQDTKLLEVHHSATSYLTTPKGSVFVKKLKELQEIATFQT